MSDFETDVQRVERMLIVCGCSYQKSKEVLEECLRRIELKNKNGI